MAKIAFHLPLPPSVNRIWRHGRARKSGKLFVFKDKKYQAWIKNAGWEMVLQMGPIKVFGPIDGPFKATIIVRKTKRKFDIDNRTKALLDLAQTMGVVTNDSNCQSVCTRYGDAPAGACLIIEPLKN